jgi:hypothetical protein
MTQQQSPGFINGVHKQTGSIHVSVSKEVKKADDLIQRDIMDTSKQLARYQEECSPIVSYNMYAKAE